MWKQAITLPWTWVRQKNGIRNLPRMLTHTVTFACNARCIMCDSWKKDSSADLNADEIERIYRQLPVLDALRITGGEPFVRRDLGEIVRMAMRTVRPAFLHVTTNGFLTERIAHFCEKRDHSKTLDVLVSLDGGPEWHNHVRGREFAFDQVMETLRVLSAMRKPWNLRLAVNQTIVNRQSITEYRYLRELLRERNVAHHVVVAYEKSATYDTREQAVHAPEKSGEFSTWGDFELEELSAFLRDIRADQGRLPIIKRLAKNYYLSGIANRLLRGEGKPNPPCAALSWHMRLMPNGDVPTCQFNGSVIGNLKAQRFSEVWFGEMAKRQHRWVRECPGCWAECEVLPSAVYSVDILRFF